MLESAIILDLLVLVTCVGLLLCFGRLSHSHPATVYLVFHVYLVTSRLVEMALGSPPLFSGWSGWFRPVTDEEIVRAALIADVALVAMTAAWLQAARLTLRRRGPATPGGDTTAAPLRVAPIWLVVAVTAPIGLAGLMSLAFLPGGEAVDTSSLGEWQSSSWIGITQTWLGLGVVALIYWYGFRWWLVVPMLLYLCTMALQGYHRFRIMIPAILLMQIYLDRRGRRWPSLAGLALMAALALLFFPLKNIGRMVQQGASSQAIVEKSGEIVSGVLRGESEEHQLLDQFASALTLIDENERFYAGTIYASLLTLPVPRQWWPDKPGLADYIGDFSRRSRPMKDLGMIVTFLGESYANFGYVGLLIVPYLLAFWLARLHFMAYRSSYFSVARIAYLLIACNLLQVYRDGLLSIVVFTFVNMMPLVLIVALHHPGLSNKGANAPAAGGYRARIRRYLPGKRRALDAKGAQAE